MSPSGQGANGQAAQAPSGPKVVGPNICGKKEEYRLERRLQGGLFGGIYEARGLTSSKDYAVKVLHKSEIVKAQQSPSMEFCEVPLSEVSFMEVMKGNKHVVEVEDFFEDNYCHYIVFALARGGDLLEALKLKPYGFDEQSARFFISQAAEGLKFLHQRRLAMQDVSLENMLLSVLEDGQYQVKVCDPGQAVTVQTDPQTGEERPVDFHGLVGKSFRPPELNAKGRYMATKVDSWCLGWSTFYLVAAQPLFLSADPAQQDADWALFKNGEIAKLFRQKGCSVSQKCVDFIMRLMDIDPNRRLSIAEALSHEWLADSRIVPVHEKLEAAAGMTVASPKVASPKPTSPQANVAPPSANAVSLGNGSLTTSTSAPRISNGSGLASSGGSLGGSMAVSPFSQLSTAATRAPSRGATVWRQPGGTYQAPGEGTPTSTTPGGISQTQMTAILRSGQLHARAISPIAVAGLRRSTGGASGGGASVLSSAATGEDGVTPVPPSRQQLGTPQQPDRPPPRAAGAQPPLWAGRGRSGESEGISFTPGQPIAGGGTLSSGNLASGLSPTPGSSSVRRLSGGGQVTMTRTASPFGQPTFVRQPQGAQARGYSPGPAGAGYSALAVPAAPGGVMPAVGGNLSPAPRSTLGSGAAPPPARENTGSGVSRGIMWQSPRAASPAGHGSTTTLRAPEGVYSRGRSNTRAVSPAQVGHQMMGHMYTTSPVGVRTVSPATAGATTLPRTTLAWSPPAPPSPGLQARAISPAPTASAFPGQPAPAGSSTLPRWVA